MFSPKYADVFFILPDKLKRQPYRIATKQKQYPEMIRLFCNFAHRSYEKSVIYWK